MCSILGFIYGSYRCRSHGSLVVFADCSFHKFTYTTHSKHQLNWSTKAILSDIIQFEAPVPFPCYHWWNFYFQRHDSYLIALLVCQSHCVLRREWNRFLLWLLENDFTRCSNHIMVDVTVSWRQRLFSHLQTRSREAGGANKKQLGRMSKSKLETTVAAPLWCTVNASRRAILLE